MDEAFVTRCPKCKTAFKVNPNLLAKANGKVRCGACLCVFDAEDHIQFASDELENSAPAAQVVLGDDEHYTAPEPAKTSTPKQGFQRTEPKLGGLDAPASRPSPAPQPVVDDFSADLTGETDDEYVFADDPDDIFDDDDNGTSNQEDSGIGEISEDFLNYRADDSMRNQFEPRAGGFTDDDDDEAWAKSLVEDDRQSTKPSSYRLLEDDLDISSEPKTSSVNITHYVAPAVATGRAKGSKVRSKSHDASAALAIDEIESHHAGGQGVFATVLWSILALVLTIALVGQYGWFERESLSQNSTLRPIYNTVCELVGCQLPNLTDVTAISVTNHQVRINPSDPGTVLVDMVQRNQASFEQPYPQVVVSFLNSQGRTTQRFRVDPEQYLTGNIKATDLMPIGVPVQVQLKLENPGNVASYRIDLAAVQ